MEPIDYYNENNTFAYKPLYYTNDNIGIEIDLNGNIIEYPIYSYEPLNISIDTSELTKGLELTKEIIGIAQSIKTNDDNSIVLIKHLIEDINNCNSLDKDKLSTIYDLFYKIKKYDLKLWNSVEIQKIKNHFVLISECISKYKDSFPR